MFYCSIVSMSISNIKRKRVEILKVLASGVQAVIREMWFFSKKLLVSHFFYVSVQNSPPACFERTGVLFGGSCQAWLY